MVCDGVTIWKIHRPGASDEWVLGDIKSQGYYQKYQGAWEVNLSNDRRSFKADSFDAAIGRAVEYIYERDTPNWLDQF
jgi:hypothetical protein